MNRPPRPDQDSYQGESVVVAAHVDSNFPVEKEDDLKIGDLSYQLQVNKLSRETVDDRQSSDENHRRARARRNKRVCNQLNDAGVDYASMKNLRTPMAMMSDIDLLVPNPSEQAKAFRVLSDDGFDFYRFRLLAHPRKVMAKQYDADPRPVDLYPDAMWIRKIVCNADAVVQRASSTGECRPSPADDLYLVATHAYSHLSVTFAELYHGVVIVDEESVDWGTLLDSARQYGCLDALTVYLLLLDEYLAVTGRDRIPEHVFDSIPNSWITRLAKRWWQENRPRTFPVQLPTWLPTVASSFYHVPRVGKQVSPRETVKDLQSHYLAAASQVLLGEA